MREAVAEMVVLCWSEAIDAHTLEPKELVDQCIPDQLHFCEYGYSRMVDL